MSKYLFLLCFLLNLPAYAAETKQAENFFSVLRHVYDTDPSLNAVRARLQETKELYPQATAGWRPTLEGQASIFATDIDNSNFGGGDGATTKDLTLTLDQPIWRGGQTFAEVREAKDLINAGEALLHQAEQDTLFKTLRAMLALSRDRDLYNLRVRNENGLQEELTAARARFDDGVLTITDVEQSKARYSRAKADTLVAKRALDISRAEFMEVTGIYEDMEFALPELDFQFPSSADELLALAEMQNPSLWIAKYEASAAEHNAVASFRRLLPQLAAFASYNKQYDPQPGIIPDSQTETIGLRAVIPLYQAGVVRSQTRQAKHAAKREKYESEATIRDIRQNVLRNYRTYLASIDELSLRETEINAADEAYKGVMEEEKLGQRTVLDLLDADRELVGARISLVNTAYNKDLANYALAADLGLLNAANLGLVTEK